MYTYTICLNSYGLHMDSPVDSLSNEFPMHSPWLHYGFSMNLLWVLLVLAYVCILHAFPMDSQWLPYGFLWMPYGFPMDSYGFPMDARNMP